MTIDNIIYTGSLELLRPLMTDYGYCGHDISIIINLLKTLDDKDFLD